MNTYFKPTLAATALAIAGASGTASAAPLTELFFQQTSTYVTGTATSVEFFGESIGLTLDDSDPEVLAWSDGDNTSSLSLNSFDSTSSPSNTTGVEEWNENEVWITDSLIQANEELTVDISENPVPNPLWIADITGTFEAWVDGIGSGTQVVNDTTTTRIAYYETLNETPCPAGSPAGGDPCSDSYTVFEIDLSPVNFTYEDIMYAVSFQLVPGENVQICTGAETEGPCTVTGASPGDGEILKVWAAEFDSTTISVAASWARVPEPSILGLFGAVLAGLGFTARRRKQLQK